MINPLKLLFKDDSESSEISDILSSMAKVFNDFGLISDTYSFLAGRYQLPIAPDSSALLVSGWLKIEIKTDLLPRGVFIQDLSDPRLLTALRSVLGRNVETRLAPISALSSLFFEVADKKSTMDAVSRFQFWYFIEMDSTRLRSIPRRFDLVDLSSPPAGRLPIFLGQGAGGSYIWFDFPTEIIGMLVCGATRSGKSVFLRSLLTQLVTRYDPSYFRCFLADFKFGVEFGRFANFPHASLFDDPMVYIAAIREEMERRYNLIKSRGFLNIFEYNDSGAPMLPYTLAFIDEMAMFKMKAGKNAMDDLIALVAQTTGCGIYWVLSTQRPSVDIVSGSLKANIPSRLSASQPTQIDYDVIFGEQVVKQAGPMGCPGRFWCLVGDSLLEFQSPFVP